MSSQGAVLRRGCGAPAAAGAAAGEASRRACGKAGAGARREGALRMHVMFNTTSRAVRMRYVGSVHELLDIEQSVAE
jgi:hypothetical protein